MTIEIIKDLIDCMENAIKSGDWKVDGACDPTIAIEKGRKIIAQTKDQQPVAWRFKTGTWWNREIHWRYVLTLDGTEGLLGLEPLYTTPQYSEETK